jgi:hypothetical protein
LKFKAHRGDSCVLLAFDIEEQYADSLAGFAVEYTSLRREDLSGLRPAQLQECHERLLFAR